MKTVQVCEMSYNRIKITVSNSSALAYNFTFYKSAGDCVQGINQDQDRKKTILLRCILRSVWRVMHFFKEKKKTWAIFRKKLTT